MMISEQRCIIGNKEWNVSTLIFAVKEQELEVFDLPVKHIDLTGGVFDDLEDVGDFAVHMKRVSNTDLSKPIILSAKGEIMDGWHRVAKALVENRNKIKAVKFETTPEPDIINE
jgi:hypothetical protein